MSKKPSWKPTPTMIMAASEHVAWEYTALLAAAIQMADGHTAPVNHEVQESFLVHVRNMAEFFHKGVREFRQDPTAPPLRHRDNIYAVDFVTKVAWDETAFEPNTKLRRAIDKTLSHMTYSRSLGAQSEIDVAFDGFLHAHGTVKLIRRTWTLFWSEINTEVRTALQDWIQKQAAGLSLPLDDFDVNFDKQTTQWGTWQLNMTPDGRV